ncbi:hypothetical protein E0E54_00420 [Azotobacter chroococcum]|nr:hypothetical protein E0E54_00420 [Azotobacter chroococcum]
MKIPTKLLFITTSTLPACLLINSSQSASEDIESILNALPGVFFAALPSLFIFACAFISKSKMFTFLCLALNILFCALLIKVTFEPLGGFAYMGAAIAQLILSFILMPVAYSLSEAHG